MPFFCIINQVKLKINIKTKLFASTATFDSQHRENPQEIWHLGQSSEKWFDVDANDCIYFDSKAVKYRCPFFQSHVFELLNFRGLWPELPVLYQVYQFSIYLLLPVAFKMKFTNHIESNRLKRFCLAGICILNIFPLYFKWLLLNQSPPCFDSILLREYKLACLLFTLFSTVVNLIIYFITSSRRYRHPTIKDSPYTIFFPWY